jgi:putative N6-adenine-specific DNA methylase
VRGRHNPHKQRPAPAAEAPPKERPEVEAPRDKPGRLNRSGRPTKPGHPGREPGPASAGGEIRPKPPTREGAERRRRPLPDSAAPPRTGAGREAGARPRRAETRRQFFASCPRGLEEELGKELVDLGAGDLTPASGGVSFTGDMPVGWKVNLWSRLAIRVLLRVAEGRYQREEDLYQAALAVDWPALFDVSRTLAVTTVGKHSPLKSLNFVSLRIKDAVCDRFRQVMEERPSVDTRNPDIPLTLFLTTDRYTLYLDLSGEPLNRRGYRIQAAAAPLNENLAAGLLRLSGWTPDVPLYDPMMGGGTILLEAGLMALNIAPGLKRHFAFEHLKDFDRIEWLRLRKDAEGAMADPRSLPIFGSDIDPMMVRAAGLNLKAAGLLDCVRVMEADFLNVNPPADGGFIVTNPPYGVRLSTGDMAGFYKEVGDNLKQHFPGWTAFMLSADPEFPKLIGLQASRRTPLFNGPLECRLYEYRLVAGSHRKPRER